MAYSDLIYLTASGNSTQGDAVTPVSYKNYVAYNRGIVATDYSGWANTFSGKFRTQIYVISGSGL